VGDNGVFEIEGAVIGSDGDAEGGVAHGRGRDSRPGNPEWKPEISRKSTPVRHLAHPLEIPSAGLLLLLAVECRQERIGHFP
jgi:hypothetical protein